MKQFDIVMNKSKYGHPPYASICFELKNKTGWKEIVTAYGLGYGNCNPFEYESYGKINRSPTGRIAGKLRKNNMRLIMHKYFGGVDGFNIRRNKYYAKDRKWQDILKDFKNAGFVKND